jgi:mercuric ion transport protein
MRAYLDKLGSFGSVITASACPACFPQLAALGTLVGLGALSSYESQIFLATKILVALAIVGHILAYFTHRHVWLVVLGAGGGVIFFLGMYVLGSEAVIYLGFLAMFAASVTDLVRRLRMRRRLRLNTKPE